MKRTIKFFAISSIIPTTIFVINALSAACSIVRSIAE